MFPFLLFAGSPQNEPVELEISGGTNVSWSPSYEYLDQVLLPTLQDAFGVRVERRLVSRGWSIGSPQRGSVWFRIQPLKRDETLKLRDPSRISKKSDFEAISIDVSIIVPQDMHESLTRTLARDLDKLFPDVELNFVLVEDSRHDARMYVMLVARSGTLRWGRDLLFAEKRKGMSKVALSERISRRVCKDLFNELSLRGTLDEFLQDQLVVFQALAEGRSSFPRSETSPDDSNDAANDDVEESMDKLEIQEWSRKDKAHAPFGEGSTHTTTARWVTAELLPHVKWFNKGTICEGIGLRMNS